MRERTFKRSPWELHSRSCSYIRASRGLIGRGVNGMFVTCLTGVLQEYLWLIVVHIFSCICLLDWRSRNGRMLVKWIMRARRQTAQIPFVKLLVLAPWWAKGELPSSAFPPFLSFFPASFLLPWRAPLPFHDCSSTVRHCSGRRLMPVGLCFCSWALLLPEVPLDFVVTIAAFISVVDVRAS